MIGEVFAINVVIDEDRKIVFVNAGEIIQSHCEALAVACRICEVSIQRKFETILTSAGGFPLDKTYYQTIKGLVSDLDILNPGGSVVIVSECSEGMGSVEFCKAQKLLQELGPEGFVRRISGSSYTQIVDQWQTEKLVSALRKGPIHLFTQNLTKHDWTLTCVHKAENVTQAVVDSINRSGRP